MHPVNRRMKLESVVVTVIELHHLYFGLLDYFQEGFVGGNFFEPIQNPDPLSLL